MDSRCLGRLPRETEGIDKLDWLINTELVTPAAAQYAYQNILRRTYSWRLEPQLQFTSKALSNHLHRTSMPWQRLLE